MCDAVGAVCAVVALGAALAVAVADGTTLATTKGVVTLASGVVAVTTGS